MVEACRTCLKLIRLESSTYHEIEGANVQLSPNSNRFKILSVIPEMALNISKKSLICTSCHQSLETIYQFKAKCLRTESMIMRYIHSKPDIEIEALDLKDVAYVNNTGFVAASNNTNTEKATNSSHENTKTGNSEEDRGTSLHRKLLERVNASLGNNNSVSLHFVRNTNATDKGGKDKAKPVEVVSVNARNNNQCEAADIAQINNVRCEKVVKNNNKSEIVSVNPVINHSENTVPYSSNQNENNVKNINELPLDKIESVLIKQEIFPEDENSTDGFDTPLDIDESITVVKHELANDYDETELIIPPENVILDVSVKSDEIKPSTVEGNVTDKPIKYDLRKRACNKTHKKNDANKEFVYDDDDDDEDDYIGDADYSNGEDDEVIKNNSLKNKGVTTVRLKCVGSNVSIRRVIPDPQINNLKLESDVSVISLADKQKSDNELQLPHLSVIPINKKRKEGDGLEIIPISKSTDEIKPLIPMMDIDVTKNEDLMVTKSEIISMEVDVILNESIKSNDSGIQNTSGSEQTDDTLFKCQVCLKNFITKSRLKTHMLCHTDERPYKCTLCIKGFNDKSTLNKHLKIHSGIKEYECEICQRQFYCKGNLNKHMSTHSGERPYRCNVCNRDFSRNEHLKQHRLIHTGDKNFECDICSKKFARRDSLIIHMMVHTGVRNYVCEYCDKRCIDSSTLKKHLRSHTGDKPYECETCHRRFTQKTHLTIHRRKHTGERPYNCNVCNKGFYSSNYLKIHKRTHTKEQPYQCDVCKKRFSTVSNLRMHKKIHTGIRDFECGICSKMFIHKHDLRKHMMVHTQEKPFSCHVCGKAFNKKVRAKQHIMNMHKEVDISTIVIEHHNTYVKTEPEILEVGSVN